MSPRTWFTADLFLGHANVIKYSHRPFADADVMNGALIDSGNLMIAPDDIVWVLGGVALGKISETFHALRNFLVGSCSSPATMTAVGSDTRRVLHEGVSNISPPDSMKYIRAQ